MSSGLSMTSVNKIKELAAAHEYELAVGILDSQDLEKSYNPQFLHVCGEIYENVGRMKDARYYYVKAHSMAPEATRIIYSLINYYLKVGYFALAERYFEEYVFFSNGDERDLKNIRYIMKKARKPDLLELYDMIFPYYRDNMDIEWSYELLILSRLLDKQDIDVIASDYKATFKTSPYSSLIDSAIVSKSTAWDSFFIYAEEENEDNKPEDEPARIIEKQQLEQDYYRMNPAKEEEAVITSMVSDESSGNNIKSIDDVEKGLKNFIKRKFKKKSHDEETAEESSKEEGTEKSEEISDNNKVADDAKTSTNVSSDIPATETTIGNKEETSAADSSDIDVAVPEFENNTTDIKVSTENENQVTESEDDSEYKFRDFVTYNYDDGFAPESETISGLSDVDLEFEDDEDENIFKDFEAFRETLPEEPEPEDEESYNSDDTDEEEYVPEVEEDSYVSEETAKEEHVPEVEEDSYVSKETAEEEYVPEVEEESYVSEETAEEEYVPEVEEDFEAEEEISEPEPEVEHITYEKYEPTPEPVVEETYESESDSEESYGSKETAEEEYVPEVEEESYVSKEMVEEEYTPEVEEDFEAEEEISEPEPEAERITYEKYEPIPESVVEETYESEVDSEESYGSIETAEEEFIPEVEEESYVSKEMAEEEFIPEVEEDFEAEEEISEPEPEVEHITYEKYEPTPEPVSFGTNDHIDEPVVEESYENESYKEPDLVVEEPEVVDDFKPLAIPEPRFELPKMDFSRFSSDLFPTLGKEEKIVEDKFEKVVSEETSRLDEKLKEEDAKLKEVEALLASLGL